MTTQRNLLTGAVAALIAVAALFAADRPWQQLNAPTASEVAARFLAPPAEYSPTLWWGWDGPITERVITRDLDGFLARGVRAVTIEPGYRMDNAPYLSPAWFQLIRTAVQAARKRDMRIWLVDEGKYPSGFAGGKFAAEHPELGMQALVVAERVPLAAGETLQRKLSPETVGALALNLLDNSSRRIDLGSGELTWQAPEGKWQVILVEHRFRSAPTRSVNNPTKGKDDKASLMDYLDPAATRQFLAYTHEQYAKVVGDEFGKTILGFRGDEPDYSVTGIPWTPAAAAAEPPGTEAPGTGFVRVGERSVPDWGYDVRLDHYRQARWHLAGQPETRADGPHRRRADLSHAARGLLLSGLTFSHATLERQPRPCPTTRSTSTTRRCATARNRKGSP